MPGQEGLALPYTLEDLLRAALDDYVTRHADEVVKKLPPEKRVEGLSPEQRLEGLSPEERRATLEALQRRVKANGSSPSSE